MVKYREMRYLTGKAMVLSSVPRLRGGVGRGANAISLQVHGWNRAGVLMGTATGHLDGAPPSGV